MMRDLIFGFCLGYLVYISLRMFQLVFTLLWNLLVNNTILFEDFGNLELTYANLDKFLIRLPVFFILLSFLPYFPNEQSYDNYIQIIAFFCFFIAIIIDTLIFNFFPLLFLKSNDRDLLEDFKEGEIRVGGVTYFISQGIYEYITGKINLQEVFKKYGFKDKQVKYINKNYNFSNINSYRKRILYTNIISLLLAVSIFGFSKLNIIDKNRIDYLAYTNEECDKNGDKVEYLNCFMSNLNNLNQSLNVKLKDINLTIEILDLKLKSDKEEFKQLKEKYTVNSYQQAENIDDFKTVLISLERRVAYKGYLETISQKILKAINKTEEQREKVEDDLLMINLLEDSEIEKLISGLKLVIRENHELDGLAIDDSKVPEISLEDVFNTLNK